MACAAPAASVSATSVTVMSASVRRARGLASGGCHGVGPFFCGLERPWRGTPAGAAAARASTALANSIFSAPVRWHERERLFGQLRLEVPRHHHLVLGLHLLGHRRDHQLARQRSGAALDPQLPVDLGLAKRVVIAGGALDRAGAEIGRGGDRRRRLGVRPPAEQVGERHVDAVRLLDRLHQLGQPRRRGERPEVVGDPVVDRERLAVVEQLLNATVARDVDAQPIGAPDLELREAGQLHLLSRRQNVVGPHLGLDREAAQRAQVRAHLVQRFDGGGIDRLARRHRLAHRRGHGRGRRRRCGAGAGVAAVGGVVAVGGVAVVGCVAAAAGVAGLDVAAGSAACATDAALTSNNGSNRPGRLLRMLSS